MLLTHSLNCFTFLRSLQPPLYGGGSSSSYLLGAHGARRTVGLIESEEQQEESPEVEVSFDPLNSVDDVVVVNL